MFSDRCIFFLLLCTTNKYSPFLLRISPIEILFNTLPMLRNTTLSKCMWGSMTTQEQQLDGFGSPVSQGRSTWPAISFKRGSAPGCCASWWNGPRSASHSPAACRLYVAPRKFHCSSWNFQMNSLCCFYSHLRSFFVIVCSFFEFVYSFFNLIN